MLFRNLKEYQYDTWRHQKSVCTHNPCKMVSNYSCDLCMSPGDVPADGRAVHRGLPRAPRVPDLGAVRQQRVGHLATPRVVRQTSAGRGSGR